MGYELNRLMTQMGVSAPSVGALPAGATEAGRAAHDQYRQQYLSRVANTPQYLQQQFDASTANVPAVMTYSPAQRFAMRPGGAGIEGVNRAVRDWFGAFPQAGLADIRAAQAATGISDQDIRNAMGQRFDFAPTQGPAGPAGASLAMRHAMLPGGGGLAQVQQSIRNTLAANPNATDEQIAAAQAATGISNRDIYGATGNYWGNVLRPPIIPVAPRVPVQTARTPETLAAFYRSGVGAGMGEAEMVTRLREQGVTDAQMNEARNNLLGVSAGTSWAEANRLAAERGQTGAVAPTTTLPAVTVTPPASTNTGGLVDYYRSAAGSGLNEAQIVNQLRAQGVTDAQMMDARNSLLGIAPAVSGGYVEPPSGLARGGGVRSLARKYQAGGSVEDDGRREFSTELSLGSDEPQRVMPRGVEPAERPEAAPVVASPAAQPLVAPAPTGTPVSQPAASLEAMVQRYMGQESSYAPELRAARERAAQEAARFEQALLSMAQQQRPAPDKAELYFRLAAAFGSPTKTGHFAESLGAVGREMGAYQQEQRKTAREDEALRRQLGLEIAKSRVGAAREDVTALRGLAGEEMKDRRALLMEYLRSGRPQSDAGKAALDKGLKQGTPEFAQFVDRYIDDKIRTGNLFKEAMVTISQGNLQVAQAGLGIKQSAEQRQQEAVGKLSPPEIKLKSETEDALRTVGGAMRDLRRALELNPGTFDTTIADKTRRTVLEETGSKDEKITNTREQENLLQSAMISSAAEKMKGVLSDSDIRLLSSVAGLNAKSIESRRKILENAIRSLESAERAQKDRLRDINAGRYRMTNPAAEGEQ